MTYRSVIVTPGHASTDRVIRCKVAQEIRLPLTWACLSVVPRQLFEVSNTFL